MKNVLLIGIGGVYNYGCEAIIRGTVSILKSINPEITVSYASYNYEDDIKRLRDCDIHIVKRQRPRRWSFKNIIRKLLSLVGIRNILSYDSTNWLDDYDTVFSIGGDIYTLDHNGNYDASLPLFLEKCQVRGIKYVLWGASVGKFEKKSKALTFFKKHLKKIDLIVAREFVTIDYLKSLGVVQNLVFAPDPAYFVECHSFKKLDDKSNQMSIGINLSPLSSLYHYNNMEVAIAKQSEAICGLANQLNCKFVFLPHVLAHSKMDNDLTYMQCIADKVRTAGYIVEMVDEDPGFIGLKQFLVKCDFIIAARMHCAVNAISMNIPTLLLAYSEKANGMADFAYGTKETVISLTDFEDYHKVADIIKKWDYVSRINMIKNFDFKTVFDKL